MLSHELKASFWEVLEEGLERELEGLVDGLPLAHVDDFFGAVGDDIVVGVAWRVLLMVLQRI